MANRRRRITWAPSAQAALDAAVDYIAQDSLSGAQKILHAVLDLADSLQTLSERGRVVPELQNPAIREVFVYSYRLKSSRFSTGRGISSAGSGSSLRIRTG